MRAAVCKLVQMIGSFFSTWSFLKLYGATVAVTAANEQMTIKKISRYFFSRILNRRNSAAAAD